ncbi:DNA repair protein RadA [Candidatus Dependentiae bacterium]|nr:DNA repair protein RadA [Candidatus Dependentiae bacterium]
MAKQKIEFNCASCGYRPPKWVGCCPSCKEWDSISEMKPSFTAKEALFVKSTAKLTSLDQVSLEFQERMNSGIDEWDRVLGGGIMPGSFLILTGDPGIGKSTLLLQIAHALANRHRVIYISSEESLEQVRLRADRLNCLNTQLMCSDHAQLESIIELSEEHKPDIVIIDSIQNCYSADSQVLPGSIGQLRESGFRLMRLAKENKCAVILTGHITKEGTIAGPKMLEHMVDAVFYLQGEDRWQTRILRAVKNRFGSIGELGFFEMHENGLQEVRNINQQLLEEASYSPGSALISYLEGSRPLLLELQALLVPTKFGIPQRVVSGVDQKQVVLMAAILEKYLRINLNAQDIFFKVGGGFKIKESGIDLGIALAILSSYFQKPLPEKSIILGEINLTGQIKPINQIAMHLNEAHKFGIQTLVVARTQKIDIPFRSVIRLDSVYQLVELFND